MCFFLRAQFCWSDFQSSEFLYIYLHDTIIAVGQFIFIFIYLFILKKYIFIYLYLFFYIIIIVVVVAFFSFFLLKYLIYKNIFDLTVFCCEDRSVHKNMPFSPQVHCEI